MSNKMEDILGLGSFDKERTIPGTVNTENREVRYLSVKEEEDFETLFKKVVRYVNPPLMKAGGAGIEGCRITLPNHQVFQAISYKDDLEGWRQQIAQGAKANDVAIAWIVDGKICLESGEKYLLGDCSVEYN